MTLKRKMAAGMTVAAMAVTPMALAAGAAAHPGTGHATPTKSSKAEEYGKLCKGQSKRRVAGSTLRGTPFSQCVAAMRKADETADPTRATPAKVCATETKKHVAGQKGTPYSDCVKSAAKLLAAKKHTATAIS